MSTFANSSAFSALANLDSLTKSDTEPSSPNISVDCNVTANPPSDVSGAEFGMAQGHSLPENFAGKKKANKRKSKKKANTGESGSKGKELVLVKKHIIKCGKYDMFGDGLEVLNSL